MGKRSGAHPLDLQIYLKFCCLLGTLTKEKDKTQSRELVVFQIFNMSSRFLSFTQLPQIFLTWRTSLPNNLHPPLPILNHGIFQSMLNDDGLHLSSHPTKQGLGLWKPKPEILHCFSFPSGIILSLRQ